jgi:signal transduction histidine kinase
LKPALTLPILQILFFGIPAAYPADSIVPAQLALLTNAQQVLDLGVDRARHSPHPVQLRGVVTYPVPGRNRFFVQDDTSGLLVNYTNRIPAPLFGQQVEVTGVAGAGQLAALCLNARVRVLGPTSMPVPHRAKSERLVAGEDFGRWVELEGRVRDLSVHPAELTLLVSSERWQFHTIIALTNALQLPLDWLDAKIRLRGVCLTEADRENKPTAFRIHCVSTNQITILETGRADVFAAALASPTELRRRTTNSDARIRIVGTVLMHSPGRRLYLQDDLGPVRTRLLLPLLRTSTSVTYVERPHLTPLEPGDRVEVVAAPAATDYTPLLVEAEYRKIGAGPPPAPVHRSITALASGHHSGELVSLRARLLDHRSQRDGAGIEQELTLEAEGRIFQALLLTSRSNLIEQLAPNSMVQITGICSAGSGDWEQFRLFRLLMRTKGDVRGLGPAPFWSLWPVGRILGAAAALVLAALGWIWLLRGRVRERTRELVHAKEELRQALAHEQELGRLKTNFVNLVSHEFRTPLGIIMSATENLENYLERLQPTERAELLADIRTSTQRMSGLMQEVLLLARVDAGKLACRPVTLELRALLERLIEEVRGASDHACVIEFSMASEAHAACADEALLRHMFTNLLSNAVKYSPLGQPVHFRIERDSDSAIFTVRDEGIGIPEADQKQLFQTFHRGSNVGERPGTGLGLVIVKRCVDLHGGTLHLESKLNAGTTVTVRLPLLEKVERSLS